MKKALIRLSLSIAIIFSLSVALLHFTRSRSVIFSFSPDPAAVRPRNYCLLHPFRDKSPEIFAEKYLKALRDGDIESIRPVLSAEEAVHIMDNEKKWPIQSWRIGDRQDRPRETELVFWVTRGNGYPGEEEVRFWINPSGRDWRLNNYGAIY